MDYFLKQYDEFIASLAAYRIRGAYALLQAFCDGLKKFVAGRMSQGIVDVLEAVQIQEHDHNLAQVTVRQRDRLAKPVVQKQPVGQTGERVILSRMGYLLHRLRQMLFCILAHADIADCRCHEDSLGTFQWAQHDFDWKPSSILPQPVELNLRAALLRQRFSRGPGCVGDEPLREALRNQALNLLA